MYIQLFENEGCGEGKRSDRVPLYISMSDQRTLHEYFQLYSNLTTNHI